MSKLLFTYEFTHFYKYTNWSDAPIALAGANLATMAGIISTWMPTVGVIGASENMGLDTWAHKPYIPDIIMHEIQMTGLAGTMADGPQLQIDVTATAFTQSQSNIDSGPRALRTNNSEANHGTGANSMRMFSTTGARTIIMYSMADPSGAFEQPAFPLPRWCFPKMTLVANNAGLVTSWKAHLLESGASWA